MTYVVRWYYHRKIRRCIWKRCPDKVKIRLIANDNIGWQLHLARQMVAT